MVSEFGVSKEAADAEDDEEKIMFSCICYPVILHLIFCMQLPFDMFSTSMSLEVRLN